MRLVCPNCGAQYEVDPSVIPDTGRDVQCSSCGHAWFHPGPAASRVARPGPAMEGQDEPAPREIPPAPPEVPEPRPAETPAAVPIAEPEPALPEIPDETPTEWPEDEPPSEDPGIAGEDGDAPAQAEAAPELRRKTLDDAVMAILREEAEREARARQAEGGGVESQPELGLAVVATKGAAAAAVTERSARLRDVETEPLEEPADDQPARKAALPDIEEINSTLRATSERGDEAAARDAPETIRRKRSGFRFGFSTAFLIAVVLLLLYVLAPAISARVPSLAPVLSAYVAAVDHVRLWLDGALKSSTEAMRPAAQTGG